MYLTYVISKCVFCDDYNTHLDSYTTLHGLRICDCYNTHSDLYTTRPGFRNSTTYTDSLTNIYYLKEHLSENTIKNICYTKKMYRCQKYYVKNIC